MKSDFFPTSPPSGVGGGDLITPGESAEEILRELKKQWFRLSALTPPFTCYSKANSNSVGMTRKLFIEDAFTSYPNEVVMKFLAWAYKRHLDYYKGKNLIFYNEDKLFISPVKARFNKAYLKSLIGRYWDLHQKMAGVHITLTASTDNYDNPLEGLKEIKTRWNRFLTGLKKKLGIGKVKNGPKLEFLTTVEPHKNGYYHMHVIIFGRTWIKSQRELLALWRGKEEKGYGLYVRRVEGSRGLNYVLKYVRKPLSDGHAGLLVLSGKRQCSTSQELVTAHTSGTGEMSLLRTETQAVYFCKKNNPPPVIDAKDAAYHNIMKDAKGFDPPVEITVEDAANLEWENDVSQDAEEDYLNSPVFWRWWLPLGVTRGTGVTL